jgi:SNF2 family DNA or RNA helicase
MIKDFNEGRIPILVAHPKSAGHGISLQHGSNIMVFFSTGWALEDDLQFQERIGPTRQAQSGYKRSVFLHRLVGAGTLEEDVIERLKTKSSVQDTLMQALKRLKGSPQAADETVEGESSEDIW